jgi:predicted ATPase/signal transduction histidine kinase/CheY-like chemotaxis protein
MISLPGYKNFKQIYKSKKSLIFRAVKDGDDLPVILKILRGKYPLLQEKLKLQHEFDLLTLLNIESAVNSYGLENYRNSQVLVLEDFGGVSLDQMDLLDLSLLQRLVLAKKLSTALADIHNCKIIHKNFCPANIVYNRETEILKIIDFGLSTRLSKENPVFFNPELLEETLAYISPEQTGRMNRLLDYRTDIYSLGVILYELFCDEPPFTGMDALEIIHCHIAYPPIPPHKKNNTPVTVSEVIMKLLAKNAEDRYQSGLGVIADLDLCISHYKNNGQVSDFEIGARDRQSIFQIPQKLYGRDSQIKKLLEGFEDVNSGGSAFSIISGVPGVGRTSLVKELQQPVTRVRGIYAYGKFEPGNRNIPYLGISLAFAELIDQLLVENNEKISAWKEKIMASTGDNGQVLFDLIPTLELIIGPQPPVKELPPREATNRFNYELEKIIKVFAGKNHPLVFFIDDLQWADSASINLLDMLINTRIKYFHLVIAYRSNEVSRNHSLLLLLDKICTVTRKKTEIKLLPLTIEQVNSFLAHALSCFPEESREFAEHVVMKTGGNPFFIIEFLNLLNNEHLISFDNKTGRWKWSLKKIRSIVISDNVVDFFTEKIEKIATEIKKILQLAACIGNKFTLELLLELDAGEPTTLTEILENAVTEGILFTVGSINRIFKDQEYMDIEYSFAHDRIHEAFYDLVPADSRKNFHQQIGRILLKRESTEYEQIFLIVNQLNLGRSREEYPEIKQLTKLNLLAGQRAKKAAAYAVAFNYFKTSLDTLSDANWKTDYKLTLSAHEETAEAAYLCGEYDFSRKLIEKIEKHTSRQLDMVKSYGIKFQAFIAENKPVEAVKAALLVLERFNLIIPEKPNTINTIFLLIKTRLLLRNKNIEELAELPEMNNPEMQAVMSLMSSASSAAYFASPKHYPFFVLRRVELSVKLGNTPWSPTAYASYGTILCAVIADFKKGYSFGELALKLVDKLNLVEAKSRILLVFNTFIAHWSKPLRTTLKPLLEGYESGIIHGDFEYAAFSASAHYIHAFFAGVELDFLKSEIMDFRETIAGLKHRAAEIWLNISSQLAASLTLPFFEFKGLNGHHFNESEMLKEMTDSNNRLGLCYYYLASCHLYLLSRQLNLAEESLQNARQYLDGVRGMYLVGIFYFYECLVVLDQYKTAPLFKRKKIILKVHRNLKKLNTWSKHCPENYLHKYYLIKAEFAKINSKQLKALRYYDKAIEQAAQQAFINEEAMANELAARFCLENNLTKQARPYLEDARDAYLKWGAVGKVNLVEKEFKDFFDSSFSDQENKFGQVSNQINFFSKNSLDYLSIVKASQVISGEIVLDLLFTRLMKIVIENAASQKGVLIIREDPGLFVKAIACVENEEVILKSIRIEESDDICIPVINYVERTRKSLVINDASIPNRFSDDPYIQKNRPKSIMATPIIHRSNLTSILYLENNLTREAFTTERQQFLHLLGTQAAISLKNAWFYAELEERVEQRTQELKTANEKVLTATKAKSEFLTNMSHEIRTPLNGVLAATELALAEKLPPKLEKFLKIIDSSGFSLMGLINDILDFSKVEAGQLQLEETIFHPKEIRERVINLFSDEINKKKIKLNFTIREDTPENLTGDPYRIQQILTNLIGNAFKFTEQSGIINIELFPLKFTDQDNIILQFSVKDTGVGIAKDKLNILFNPFTQADSSTTRKYGGTGLGLTISKKLVEMMAGKIWVESKIGKGSIFSFTVNLKYYQSEQQQGIESNPDQTMSAAISQLSSAQEQLPGKKFNGCRVLVAEDNPTNQEIIEVMLEEAGVIVEIVDNGKKVIELLLGQQPMGNDPELMHESPSPANKPVAESLEKNYHLVLLDIEMPEMDGITACKKLRESPLFSDLPIVAMTAYSLEEGKDKYISAGMNDFLAKPLSFANLYRILNKFLPSQE